jgi:hypothetical protein
MMLCLLALTNLTDDAARRIVFWVLSTWFWEALTVFPCLAITGSGHDASRVLHVLKDFCPQAVLLAGFRRNDLDALRGYRTLLIAEPHLNQRLAAFLSNLTDGEFQVVGGGYIGYHSKSIAIYAGEDPITYQIQNAIHIHLAPTSTEPAASPRRLQEMMRHLPEHLKQYRDRNLDHVIQRTWAPSGLSSETATIASELGRCIVGAPELQRRLVALMKTRDSQRRSDMSNTIDAIVLEATWMLSRDEREQVYAGEIAAKANLMLEARGERARLSPTKVGHCLKRLGLHTHRLSQDGNGLTYDEATIARIDELATMFLVDVMEDALAEANNLHTSQATESKKVE